MDQLLTIEQFQGKEQQQYTAATDQGGNVDFTLTAVEALPERNPNAKRTPFSLMFLGPKEAQFKQATIELTHASLEAPMPIFIVATGVSQDAPGCLIYQAIFN